MMKLCIAVLLCAAPALPAFADDPAYVVTLVPGATIADPAELAGRLARTYGGSMEAVVGGTITIRLAPSRAALLGRDPHVQSITAGSRSPERVGTDAINWSAGVSYSYDGSGNIRAIGGDTFSYDVVGRLVEGHTAGVTRQYEYDAFGNRTKCSPSCQPEETISATSNHSDLLSYDARGNVIAQSGHTFVFDEFHMMTSDQYGPFTREFIYNANDERVGVLTFATSGSWWRWTFRDPLTGKVLREFTSQGIAGTTSWKWEKDYVWRDNVLLATLQPTATGTATTTYHYHVDHLGTPRRITDDSDLIVGVHDYHPFGAEASGGTTESSLSLMKYTGHERDIIDGQGDVLDYMHARYYSPSAGKFLSVDPALNVERATRRPQGWNRYAYALNSPLTFVDRTGGDAEIAASSNVAVIKQYVAELMRRPTGRADVMAVVNDHNFLLRMQSGTLTSPAQIQIAIQRHKQIHATFGSTVQTGQVSQSAPGAPGQWVVSGATMTLDPNAISTLHPDKTGTATAGHEFDHTNSLRTGGIPAMHAGDIPSSATGPSEQHGRAVAAEKPDMTLKDALKLVDQLIPVKP